VEVLLSVVVEPAQTTIVPVIGAGNGLTVIIVLITQPVVFAVNVMATVPALIPVTRPVVVPMVALPGLLLVQVPPPPVKLNS
jgi:hypothetical protein